MYVLSQPVMSNTLQHHGLLSMGFSQQEYWSGLPFPPPAGIPDSGMEVASPLSPALGGRFFTTELTRGAQYLHLTLVREHFKAAKLLITE